MIKQVLPQVNNDRKRIISIKFILRQIFRVLENKFIPLSKSKKTLKYYNHCWSKIYEIIKDDIHKIINR